jgi:deoxyadenosine/deoxycytidine kinase
MLTYDENSEPYILAWEYCERRLQQAEIMMVSTNLNYKGTYRSFIKWFEDYNRHILMVIENDHENENENENQIDTVLGTGVSDNGTVYIT